MSTSTERAVQVNMVGTLAIGRGHYGEGRGFSDPSDAERFAGNLASHTQEPTVLNTADCGDDRKTIALANGVADPSALRERITRQLFGGIGLASTSANVIAGATVVADAKSMTDAYIKVVDTFKGLRDESGNPYEDAGHAKCGRSAEFVSTLKNRLPVETTINVLASLVPLDDNDKDELRKIDARKQRLLDSGFFNDWNSEWHEKRLEETVPHNFSALDVKPDSVGGHHGRGLYLVPGDGGLAFSKNAFIEDTGEMAFATTLGFAERLANQFGVSPEERRRIFLAFLDDALNTGDALFAKDMSLFV